MSIQSHLKARWAKTATNVTIWNDKVFGSKLMVHVPFGCGPDPKLDTMLVHGSFHSNAWTISFGKVELLAGGGHMAFVASNRCDMLRDNADILVFLKDFVKNVQSRGAKLNMEEPLRDIAAFLKKAEKFDTTKREDNMIYGMAEPRHPSAFYIIPTMAPISHL